MFDVQRSLCQAGPWILAIFMLAVPVMAQSNTDVRKLEREVRLLDQAAAKAILERDEAAIDIYFAPNAVTNNPRSGLTYGNEGVKTLMRSGVINYASFERTIEHVELHGNTAVVMGNENFQMAAKDGKPGQIIKRRYTNIWMKSGSKWKIIARHANIVCE